MESYICERNTTQTISHLNFSVKESKFVTKNSLGSYSYASDIKKYYF